MAGHGHDLLAKWRKIAQHNHLAHWREKTGMTMREKISARRNAGRGFSLFEVLIAVSLLALLSIVTISALRFGVTAWRKGDAAMTEMEEVSFAQQFLRRSLSAAYPRLAGDGAQSVEFVGSAKEIQFVGPVPNSVSPAARAYFTIKAEQTPNGETLIAEILPELMGDESAGAVVRETLIVGMKSFRFSYLAGGETEWRDNWIGMTRLPALIRIDAEPMEGSSAVWPTLLIAPQIDVDASCRYDRLSKYCQGRR